MSGRLGGAVGAEVAPGANTFLGFDLKNVFAPGANFGAYSSTKAAAHQLARIASLEFAADDVRVNMVAPDAVFGNKTCRSGSGPRWDPTA